MDHFNTLRVSTVLGALLLAAVSPAQADNAKSDEFLKNGMERLEKKDIRGATIQFRNALQENPDNLAARLQLGRVMLMARQFAAAEKELSWVLDRQPSDEIRVLRARALLGLSKFEEAMEALPERMLDVTMSPIERFLRGSILGGLQKSDEALKTIEPLMRDKSPYQIQSLYLAANIEIKRQNYTAANAHLDRILSLDPKSALAMILKAQNAVYARDYGKALDLLNAAYEIEPNSAPLEFLRIESLIRVGDIALAEERIKVAKEKYGGSPNNKPRLVYLSSLLATAREDFEHADTLLVQVADKLRRFNSTALLQGLVKFQTGQYSQAANAFKRYLRDDPDNREVRLLLGTSHLLSDDPRSAIEAVERIAQGPNASPAALRLLARANVKAARYNTAITVYEELARRGSSRASIEAQAILALLGTTPGLEDNPNAENVPRDRILQAIDMVKSGKVDEAMKEARALEQTLPENPLVLNLLGTIHFSKNETDKGRAYLERAVEKDPTFLAAIYVLDRLDAAKEDFAAIEARLKKGLKYASKNEGLILRYANFLENRGRRKEAIALLEKHRRALLGSLLLRQTLYSYYRSNDDNAGMRRVAADMEVIGSGGKTTFLAAAGQAYVELKSYDKAISVFKTLRELAPNDQQAAVGLIEALALADRADEAFKMLTKLLGDDANDTLVATTLADFFARNEKFDKALATVERFESQNPALADAIKAKIYAAKGDTKAALAILNAAAEKHPNDEVMYTLFLARLKDGDPDGAVSQLKGWLEKNPGDVKSQTTLGSYLIGKGDYKGAEKHLETALLAQPNSPLILNNLAWTRYKLKRAGAVALARRAHRLAPNSADVKDTLGWLLVQEGSNDQAIVVLRQAARIKSDSPDILYHLAVPLHRTGKMDEARKVLQMALASKQPFQARGDAEALLKQIK